MIGNNADPQATTPSYNTRRGTWRRGLVASLAALIGCATLAATPALADHKHNKWQQHDKYSNDRHWKEKRSKHGQWYGAYHSRNHGYNHGPRVIYVEEPRYYVVPAPHYHPAPVIYSRPSINIVLPLFD